MKKNFVFHPFLLAIFPIVFLVAHNLKISGNFSDIASPLVVLLLLGISLGFAGLILIGLSLLVYEYQ